MRQKHRQTDTKTHIHFELYSQLKFDIEFVLGDNVHLDSLKGIYIGGVSAHFTLILHNDTNDKWIFLPFYKYLYISISPIYE